MKKFSINNGSLIGLVLVACAIITRSLGIDENQSSIPSILNNLVIVFGIYYFIVQYRDTQNSGLISYSESLKLGTSLSFFASVVLAFYTVFYINFIDSEFINNLISQTEQQILMSRPDISDDELDKMLELSSRLTKPHWLFINGMLGITLMGFLFSIFILWFWGNWLLFEKANEEGWYSLIPIYNIIVNIRIVGKPEWWIFLYFVPLVNVIAHFIIMNELRKCFRKDDVYTIGLFFLGIIFKPALGINNDEYIRPNNSQTVSIN